MRTLFDRLGSDIHVSIENMSGSIEHYYHFLLGFLVPIICEWPAFTQRPGSGRVYVRSCAIFDDLLCEADLPRMEIIPAAEHAKMATARGPMRFLTSRSVPVTLTGYDDHTVYRAEKFRAARAYLQGRLREAIAGHSLNLAGRWPAKGPKILVLDRGPADPFYASQTSEIKTAGAQRRSIPNFQDLRTALSRQFENAVFETLEGRSLAEQIALFQNADIIVAQHGAALANLIWRRPGATLIEIAPRPSDRGDDGHLQCFERLAACLSLRYQRVWQISDHAPVAVDDLLGALNLAIHSPLSAQSVEEDAVTAD